MRRLLCLFVSLFVINLMIQYCLGNVMEIFNHPEERRTIREGGERSNFYDNDKDMDDLYLPRDDYDQRQPYIIDSPSFQKTLTDALSRIKYVDKDTDKQMGKTNLKDGLPSEIVNNAYEKPILNKETIRYQPEITDRYIVNKTAVGEVNDEIKIKFNDIDKQMDKTNIVQPNQIINKEYDKINVNVIEKTRYPEVINNVYEKNIITRHDIEKYGKILPSHKLGELGDVIVTEN